MRRHCRTILNYLRGVTGGCRYTVRNDHDATRPRLVCSAVRVPRMAGLHNQDHDTKNYAWVGLSIFVTPAAV